MPELTFNRNDWSGEHVTVEYGEVGGEYRFEFGGYRFLLASSGDPDDLALTSPAWRRPLFYVRRCEDRGRTTYEACSMGVERESGHPVQTAVEILCNTL